MGLTEERARGLLVRAGAILEGHFVGTNGSHLSAYVAKDRGTRLTSIASELCKGIAGRFAEYDVDAVVAPAVGGIALSTWTAFHISQMRPDRPEVLALYSEHDETFIMEAENRVVRIPLPEGTFDRENEEDEILLLPGEKLIVRKPSFVLKRGFAADVCFKRVLEVEDILTTGGSAAQTASAIVQAGGILVGLGVLANGGNVKPRDCGVEQLEALITVNRQIFTEQDCAARGLCARGVAINTYFGHGKEFLARKLKQK